MQNPAIVKEICNVPGEISILHNRSSPSDNICGLTISILFFCTAVNETNCELVLRFAPEPAADSVEFRRRPWYNDPTEKLRYEVLL